MKEQSIKTPLQILESLPQGSLMDLENKTIYTEQEAINAIELYHDQFVVQSGEERLWSTQPIKIKEEILEPYRLYLFPEVFGDAAPKEKVSWDGAIKAMEEFAEQQLKTMMLFYYSVNEIKFGKNKNIHNHEGAANKEKGRKK